MQVVFVDKDKLKLAIVNILLDEIDNQAVIVTNEKEPEESMAGKMMQSVSSIKITNDIGNIRECYKATNTTVVYPCNEFEHIPNLLKRVLVQKYLNNCN